MLTRLADWVQGYSPQQAERLRASKSLLCGRIVDARKFRGEWRRLTIAILVL